MSTNWKVWMKAVCVSNTWMKWNNYSWWQRQRFIITGKRPKGTGPAYGETVEVCRIHESVEFGLMLAFTEYGSTEVYTAWSFRPLLDDLNEAALDRIESEPKEVPELIPA